MNPAPMTQNRIKTANYCSCGSEISFRWVECEKCEKKICLECTLSERGVGHNQSKTYPYGVWICDECVHYDGESDGDME